LLANTALLEFVQMNHFTVTYDSTVAEVVLSNPKKFNMLSLAWGAELDEILVSLESNDAVRLRRRSFCVCD
jgi:enoyl-CoA hydratase/carnithine racemase